jgi:DNA polymerase I
MRDVTWDIEGDDLLDNLTTVHCLVIKDLDTGQRLSCTDASPKYPSIAEGLEVLRKAKRHYGHNLIGYDIPGLQKLYPGFELAPDAKVFDTLVMVQQRFAHIKESDYERCAAGKLPSHLAGSHGIEAWGYRLGIQKGEFTQWCKAQGIENPWAEWRPEMQSYCEQDVDVNEVLVRKLRQAGLSSTALEVDTELAFYLAQQERNGWPIHEENLRGLIASLTTRKQELESILIDHFGSWYVPKGEFTPKKDNRKMGYVAGATCTKIELVEFNPNSRQNHIANRLIKVYGWQPTEFTPSGQPKVDESTLKGLDIPIAKELEEYLMVSKRLGQITEGKQAWTLHLTKDGYQGGRLTDCTHIHHSIRRSTVTHRGIHSHPNLGQVPRASSPYGPECRSSFTVPGDGEGEWVLVGSDADGLELRCLAHFLYPYDGGKYAEAILSGRKENATDVHSINAKALGLSRDDGKTWVYAWLYGSGNENLGSISGATAEEIETLKGTAAWQKEVGYRKRARKPLSDMHIAWAIKGGKQKARFLKQVPALAQLKEKVDEAVQRGYVTLPDGRRTYIRSAHSALNFLLQGAGAVICRHWIVEFNRRLMERFGTPSGGGWQYAWAAVGWIHDEVQLAVRREYADEVAQILVDSMPPVAEQLGWRLPLVANADIGPTWRETH